VIKEKTQPVYYVKQQLQAFENQSVYEYQNDHLAEKVPEYRYLMNEYRDGTLMFKVMEQNVWTKALTDTAGLNKYFAENRNKYMWKERAKAKVYYCDSEKLREQLKEELQKDYYENTVVKFSATDFGVNLVTLDTTQKIALQKLLEFMQNEKADLVELQGYTLKNEKAEAANLRIQAVKNYLVKAGIAVNRIAEKNLGKLATAKKGGVSYKIYSNSDKMLLAKYTQTNPLAMSLAEGTFERGGEGMLDKLDKWEAGKFERQKDKQFAYIIITEVMPPTQKKLNETKGVVVTDYQNYLENTWVESLRKKYKVTINEQALKKIAQP
jgi:peptidyl-prolyl cis-trans isomerase SurA